MMKMKDKTLRRNFDMKTDTTNRRYRMVMKDMQMKWDDDDDDDDRIRRYLIFKLCLK